MLNLTRQDLLKVEKPARYVGGEFNQVIKNKDNICCRFAFCFPDIYDVGMSNLGMKILYDILNKREDTWCERVFAPWNDFETIMRKKNIPLYALESKDSIADFDIIGFTLVQEMNYTNVLNMLDLAGIPVLAKERTDMHPLVVAGGQCTCNPYPMSNFIDLFMIGDGEELIDTLVQLYIDAKNIGLTKAEFLNSVKDIDGIFIPSLHTKYNYIKKAFVKDLNTVSYPTKLVVPNIKIRQDKILLELSRGCSNSCRLYQPLYNSGPVRQRSVKKLTDIAKSSIYQTGQNEISLSSFNTCDFPKLNDLVDELINICIDKNVEITFPSISVESLNMEILNKLDNLKSKTLTLTPEAGSQRLRDVIDKKITKEEILNSCKLAFLNGYYKIKIYYTIGLPNETYTDLEEIVSLSNEIVDIFYNIPEEKRNKKLVLTVITSTFVPKPHTPFEWYAQNTIDKVQMKQQFLKEKITNKNIVYKCDDARIRMIEAAISRGDEYISDVIYEAFLNGAKLDNWKETLNYNAWMYAFNNLGINPKEYASKEYAIEDKFVWDNILSGADKELLKNEYKEAMSDINATNIQKNIVSYNF